MSVIKVWCQKKSLVSNKQNWYIWTEIKIKIDVITTTYNYSIDFLLSSVFLLFFVFLSQKIVTVSIHKIFCDLFTNQNHKSKPKSLRLLRIP